MADKQSAVAKLREKLEKEKREYKCEHDVQRVHHLIAAVIGLKEYPPAGPLAAALGRELQALSLKQADLDTEERKEAEKELAAAEEADAKAAKAEAEHANPPPESKVRSAGR